MLQTIMWSLSIISIIVATDKTFISTVTVLAVSIPISIVVLALGLLVLMWHWIKRKTKGSSDQQINQPSSDPVYETVLPQTNTIELKTNEAYGNIIQLKSNEAYDC